MVHKKHHYTPQCYLRGFSHEAPKNIFHLFIYDRIIRQSLYPNIDDIFSQNYLYKPRPSAKNYIRTTSNDIDNIFEVDFFATFIEPWYKHDIDLLNEHINNGTIFPLNKKFDFSCLMAIQLLRLPLQKVYFAKRFEKLVELFKYQIVTNELHFDPKLICSDDSFIHFLSGYGNMELIETLAKFFFSGKWEFYIDQKGRFYTSDCPIVLMPSVCELHTNKLYISKDIRSISFPVTKEILLNIDVRDLSNKNQYKTCLIIKATEQIVTKFNCQQFLFCDRQVASYYNDFSFIEDILNITDINFISNKEIISNGTSNNA